MIVEGNSGKVDSYKFTAIVFTGLYLVFEALALLNDTVGNLEYTQFMRNAIRFQQIGVGICVIIYDIIAIHKWYFFKKKDKLVYLIHPLFEKVLEGICLVCGVIGFGMAIFY